MSYCDSGRIIYVSLKLLLENIFSFFITFLQDGATPVSKCVMCVCVNISLHMWCVCFEAFGFWQLGTKQTYVCRLLNHVTSKKPGFMADVV